MDPYVGPRPFERNEHDSARFFGRSRETQEIISLIFGHPLTLIYAQSGAGKTSLINASITPALQKEGFDVLPPTRVGGIVPKGVALREIENLYIFNALLNIERDANLPDLMAKSLTNYLEERPRTTDLDGIPLPRVMIFDQFEELFTYTPENWREQRGGFFLQIMKALETDPLLRIVFVIREDFLAQLDPYARSLSERLRTRYRLERLQEEAALHAIKDPLATTTRSFAPGVAEGLVQELLFTRTTDAAGKMVEIIGQYVEPVQLQVVCVTLWSNLEPDITVITQGQLQDFNVNIALSDFYESAIQSAVKDTDVDEKELRDWFGKTMITSIGTRSTIFRGKTSTGGIPNSAVDYLESRHIIRAEFRAGVRWYELTHDRFIEAILANNKEWFAKRLEMHGNPLTEPAQEWIRLGRDEGSLLRGASLDEMDNWAEAHPNELDDLEREFLEASWALYQKELDAKTRSEKRLRALVIGLGVALVFAMGAIITAFNRAAYANEQSDIASDQKLTAQAAADIASTARAEAINNAIEAGRQAKAAQEGESEARAGKLAIQAISSLRTDPQLGLLLAIEANRIRHTLETDDTLRQAMQASQAKAILALQNNVNALVFSQDGKYLVTGDAAGVVALRVSSSNTIIRTALGDENNTASVNLVVFDREGVNFATGKSDGSVDIFNLQSFLDPESRQSHIPLKGLTTYITSLTFSRDGYLVAAASADGSVAIWDISKQDAIVSLKGHTAQINTLTFNRAGDRIVTASSDATAGVWDAGTGRKLFTLKGHVGAVNVAVFNPDDNVIVTAGADSTVRLWSAENGQEITALEHTGSVTNMIFNPNIGWLITLSSDNIIRFWNFNDVINNSASTPAVIIPTGHSDRITSLTISPDGQYTATTSADSTARFWNTTGELQTILRGHTSSVNAVAFMPDSKTLATTSSDNTIRLWDTSSGGAQRILQGHTETIWDIAISPAGTFMTTKGEDATLLWDFERAINSNDDQEPDRKISEGAEIGFGVDFSHDGNYLATSSIKEEEDGIIGKVTVTDTTKPSGRYIVWTKDFPGQAVYNLAFAPSGDLLAISLGSPEFGSVDGKIYLWNIFTDSKVGEITSNIGGMPFGLAFNSDGSLLAVGAYNESPPGGFSIWRVANIITGSNKTPSVKITSSEFATVPVAFSPDGNYLASGNSDGTVRLWNVLKLLNTDDHSESRILNVNEENDIVLGLEFSLDGQLLAGADLQGIIRVWDTLKLLNPNEVNPEILNAKSQGDAIYTAAFSADGNWLVTAGESATISIWPIGINNLMSLACKRATRNLTQTEWETYFGADKAYKRTCLNLPYHATALDAMVEQGMEFARQDRIEEAVALWNRVNDIDPQRALDADLLLAEVYLEKGDQLVHEGDYDESLEFLQKAIDLDPSLDFKPEKRLADMLWEVGSVYIDTGEFDKAARAIKKALELDPAMDAQMAQNWAYVSAAIGDYDQALEVLQEANELDPSLDLDPEVKLKEMVIDNIIKYASNGDYEEAKESLERSEQLDSNIYRELKLNQMYSDEVETESGDLWIFDGKAGQSISIQMKDKDSGLDTYLTLISLSGYMATNDDFDGTDSQINYTLEEDGIYLIIARGYAGATGAYTITVTSVPEATRTPVP